ncbi:universal stress protein [Streptomyces flavotricini]|uniref:Universal stress protein n=1 Tax=Streptomyces flavotricini TaxID=66888 RepID=A0ABS8E0A6_9ACTN|nr:universal stress protein [Streptomyces flavotricini]MCC0094059.1 universal stress protein [Streptomyces flavotricini]
MGGITSGSALGSAVVGVDGSDSARQAGRELPDATATATAEAEQFPGLKVDAELSRSAPVPSLHRSAGLRGTSVVGNRGAGGFGSLMLGSVGLEVTAGAQTPVLMVRGIDNDAETGVVLAAVRDEHDLECGRYAARARGSES